jgi:hypothetical protein
MNRLRLLFLAGVVLVIGCDRLLSVTSPSLILADGLEVPGNAGLLESGAAADFECAFAMYTVAGGLVGNELQVSTTLISTKEYDARTFNPTSSDYAIQSCDANGTVGVYIPLSTARWMADEVSTNLQKWTDAEVPNRQDLLARSAAYSGYSLVLLGEAMCDAAINVGPKLTPAQLFDTATARFGIAIAAAKVAGSGTTDALNLAYVGRARAEMRLGLKAQAEADAKLVPADFVFNATFNGTPPRRNNWVWQMNNNFAYVTIDPSYEHLTFGGVPDPRVAVDSTGGPASDGVTLLWTQTKYPAIDSPMPIATGAEAQLIIAEVEGGQTAVTIINQLHAAVGLPPFASTDPTAIQNQILYERKTQLFLDSHNLGDIRQYNIPLTPAPGTAFKDGGTYGSQTCFPLPANETDNNPNI